MSCYKDNLSDKCNRETNQKVFKRSKKCYNIKSSEEIADVNCNIETPFVDVNLKPIDKNNAFLDFTCVCPEVVRRYSKWEK